MLKSFTSIRRSLAIAGAAALASGSFAMSVFDAQIMIERAVNSPTMTVKYDGANVSLVELRINGESFATRAVSSNDSKGEANFTVTVTDLKDGENEVEVRLYDKTGKVVSSQKQTILTDQSNRGPVYITGPKQGATVSGPVSIKLGFGKEMRNVFVSFFIDGDHKSFTNTPPFEYLWDTQKESNGWHTVEAWVVDEATNTFKTKQVRVFVNNAGGRTVRKGLGTGEPTVAKTTAKATLVEPTTPAKAAGTTPVAKAGNVATTTAPAAPKTVASKVISNKVVTTAKSNSAKVTTTKAAPAGAAVSKVVAKKAVATIENPSGAVSRVATSSGSTAMSNQDMTPTGLRLAGANLLTPGKDFVLETAKRLLSVNKGTRLHGVKTFSVLLNGQFVEFDVAPRVDEGVPMTPFRHLIEKSGGNVDFIKGAKIVNASADGKKIWLKVGDSTAKINGSSFALELAPYIDRGRTIVPLSFMKDALGVEIDFDAATGHVLITKKD